MKVWLLYKFFEDGHMYYDNSAWQLVKMFKNEKKLTKFLEKIKKKDERRQKEWDLVYSSSRFKCPGLEFPNYKVEKRII